MRFRASILLLASVAWAKPTDFVAKQQADGAWRDGPRDVTPVVLLAFLGSGHTDKGATPAAKAVAKGLAHLVGRQRVDGSFGDDLVFHATATTAAGEAWWMTRNPRYKPVVGNALAHLVRQQRPDGSFGDATLWAAAALASAAHGGLGDPAATAKLKAWVEAQPLPKGDAATAARHLLIRIFAGEKPPALAIDDLADIVLKAPVDLADTTDVHALHLWTATVGMFQIGGAAWGKWNKSIRGLNRTGAKTVYRAALRAKCLEVYYRYDRVFGTKGKAVIGVGGRRVMGARGGSVRRADNTEAYDSIAENGFQRVADHDTSTFAADVDTASHANVRRFLLRENRLPPKDAVRVEELINYFRYDDPPPAPGAAHPIAASAEVAACPWKPEHRLCRIALAATPVELRDRPATNLVFLLDVSGSMQPAKKLPLLLRAMLLLVDQLDARDRVSIVVYAGAAGLVLPPTPGDRKGEILGALAELKAGGSTNGGAGIQLAYRIAKENFIEGGANRVVLATDGDFNVGVSDRGSLVRLVEEQAKGGVFLSVLGFGTGNLKDARMEELSNKGNGNYAYVDGILEARKVLVEQLSGTLVTVAKDVKIQLFFNPARVAAYRLIGYENRLLRKEDFDDDRKDAGDVGAGHRVTALYEIVPAGGEVKTPKADDNPFVERARLTEAAVGGPLLRLRVRYKKPDGETSTLIEQDVTDAGSTFDAASTDLRWAAAVASFGMLLRDSEHKAGANWDLTLEIAGSATGADPHGYRAGFLEMARHAKTLADGA